MRPPVVDRSRKSEPTIRVVAVPEPEVAEPRTEATTIAVSPVLVSPRGWRLEGLTLSAALGALERLG